MNPTEGRMRSILISVGSMVFLLVLWWLLALTILSDARVPTPDAVVRQVLDDGFAYYWRHFAITTHEAALGFVYGNVAALVLAMIVLLFPIVEPVAMQIAVISYCIPIVAIAPVLYIVIGPATSGEPSGTAVALATMSVFFTTVVGTLVGLRSADKASLDVVTVYGGGRFSRMRKVQIISALPAILAALQVAAPAAFLGAILGEYVGGVERGVGLALTTAQQNLAVERAWAIGFGCAIVAGLVFAFFALLSRFVTPWSKGAHA